MKKLGILAAAAVLTLSCTACGMGNVTTSGASGAAVSSAASAVASSQAASSTVSVDPTKYDDSLQGLMKYMTACGYVEGNATKTEAQLIGAKAGYRYSGKVDGKQTVTIELYEYATSGVSSTGQKVLDSVKSNGSFTLFDKTIPAVLSNSGKYMMIYKDTDTGSTHTAHQKQAEENFKNYKA